MLKLIMFFQYDLGIHLTGQHIRLNNISEAYALLGYSMILSGLAY